MILIPVLMTKRVLSMRGGDHRKRTDAIHVHQPLPLLKKKREHGSSDRRRDSRRSRSTDREDDKTRTSPDRRRDRRSLSLDRKSLSDDSDDFSDDEQYRKKKRSSDELEEVRDRKRIK